MNYTKIMTRMIVIIFFIVMIYLSQHIRVSKCLIKVNFEMIYIINVAI
jgi:hypothetical protein